MIQNLPISKLYQWEALKAKPTIPKSQNIKTWIQFQPTLKIQKPQKPQIDTNKRKTWKSGALNPKETPLDSVLAARTNSFLAGTVLRSCNGFKPILENQHLGMNWFLIVTNVRGGRNKLACTEHALAAVAAAMAATHKVSFFIFYFLFVFL